MKFKHVTIAILALVACNTLSAQVKFGVKGSFNFFNVNGKNSNGDNLNNQLLITYNLGVIADIPVADEFSVQPGVFFAPKGFNNKENNIKTVAVVRYLEVPVNLMFKPALGDGNMLLGFGPYVGFGLGGKVSSTPTNGTSHEAKVAFKNKVTASDLATTDKVFVRPMDAGINLLAGYQFSNGFLFNINASLGLTKINPEVEGASNDKSVAKNTGFGLSVGYMF